MLPFLCFLVKITSCLIFQDHLNASSTATEKQNPRVGVNVALQMVCATHALAHRMVIFKKSNKQAHTTTDSRVDVALQIVCTTHALAHRMVIFNPATNKLTQQQTHVLVSMLRCRWMIGNHLNTYKPETNKLTTTNLCVGVNVALQMVCTAHALAHRVVILDWKSFEHQQSSNKQTHTTTNSRVGVDVALQMVCAAHALAHRVIFFRVTQQCTV